MKKSVFCFLVLLSAAAVSVFAQARSGVVEKVSAGDVLVRYDDVARPFQAGEKIHVAVGDESVELDVVYPMQTVAKCRVSGKSSAASKLKKGMAVFRGKPLPKKDVSRAAAREKKESVPAPHQEKGSPFRDNGDGTLTDTRTGLMWMQNAYIAGKQMSWDDAKAFCAQLRTGGFSDWRLPTAEEYRFIIKDQKHSQNSRGYLYRQGFEKMPDYCWTSTEAAGGDAVAVLLYYTEFRNMGKRNTNGAWPVRSTKR